MIVQRISQIITLLIIPSSVFSTSNICSRIENYTVTSMETYTEPVVVNTFTWCLQIPPRCPKTRTEMRQRYRVKTQTKTRSIQECCEGYKNLSSRNDDDRSIIRCVPFCENCFAGVCISPNECQCDPGYRGVDCSSECPLGTWGALCKRECNCGQDVPCNPTNGHCLCPPGLQGQNCDESCPNDRWGPGCIFPCNCADSSNACHSETGQCIATYVSTENTPSNYPQILTEKHSLLNSTSTVYKEDSTEISEKIDHTTDEISYESSIITDNIPKATNLETTPSSTSKTLENGTQRKNVVSTTARPVIVLVSVPERRRNMENDRPKFSMKNPFFRHGDDNHLRDLASPKTDFVKTIHKDEVQPAPIPLDIALIVVASIISLGLTSVAVVMVLHMRSKLFETARFSMYEEEKTKSQERESMNAGRISTILGGGLTQSPVHISPLFSMSPESARILNIQSNESSNNYINDTTNIGVRISGNIHDLLQEDHYDRPPTTLIRLQPDFDHSTEHVYDEIPLQSTPLSTHKNV